MPIYDYEYNGKIYSFESEEQPNEQDVMDFINNYKEPDTNTSAPQQNVQNQYNQIQQEPAVNTQQSVIQQRKPSKARRVINKAATSLINNKSLKENLGYANNEIAPDQVITGAMPIGEDNTLYGGVKNNPTKPTPFRDFGVNVGRFLMPKGLENNIYGSIEENKLLREDPDKIPTYDMINEDVTSGRITPERAKELAQKRKDYDTALYNKENRDYRNKAWLDEAVLLGTAALPLPGINAVSRLGLNAGAKVFNAAKNVGINRGVSKFLGNLAKGAVTTPLRGGVVGSQIGILDNGIKYLEGENNIDYMGNIENSVKAAMLLDGIFSGAGATLSAAAKTKLGQKIMQLPPQLIDAGLEYLRNNNAEAVADFIENGAVNLNRILFSDIPMPNIFGKSISNKGELVDKIRKATNNDVTTAAAEYNSQIQGATDEELSKAELLAESRYDNNGNLIANRPLVDKTLETEKSNRELIPDEEIPWDVDGSLEEEAKLKAEAEQKAKAEAEAKAKAEEEAKIQDVSNKSNDNNLQNSEQLKLDLFNQVKSNKANSEKNNSLSETNKRYGTVTNKEYAKQDARNALINVVKEGLISKEIAEKTYSDLYPGEKLFEQNEQIVKNIEEKQKENIDKNNEIKEEIKQKYESIPEEPDTKINAIVDEAGNKTAEIEENTENKLVGKTVRIPERTTLKDRKKSNINIKSIDYNNKNEDTKNEILDKIKNAEKEIDSKKKTGTESEGDFTSDVNKYLISRNEILDRSYKNDKTEKLPSGKAEGVDAYNNLTKGKENIFEGVQDTDPDYINGMNKNPLLQKALAERNKKILDKANKKNEKIEVKPEEEDLSEKYLHDDLRKKESRLIKATDAYKAFQNKRTLKNYNNAKSAMENAKEAYEKYIKEKSERKNALIKNQEINKELETRDTQNGDINVSDDVIRSMQEESNFEDTKLYNDYKDNTSNEIQQGLHEVDNGEVAFGTEYANKDTAEFLNSYMKATTDEEKSKIVFDKVKSFGSVEELKEFMQKVYNETELTGRKSYKPGLAGEKQYKLDKEKEDKILNAFSDLNKARKVFKKINDVPEEHYNMTDAEEGIARERLINAERNINNVKAGNGNSEYSPTDDIKKLEEDFAKEYEKYKEAENLGKEEVKKALGKSLNKIKEQKEALISEAKRNLYERTNNTIAKRILDLKDRQETYDAYVKLLANQNDLRYNKYEVNASIKQLNKIVDYLSKEKGISINKYKDADSVIRLNGEKLMKELKKYNEEENLSDGFSLIENNRDLFAANIDKDYNWKYFNDDAIGEHYEIADYYASSMLRRLKNPSTRKAAILEIEEKKANSFKDLIDEKLEKYKDNEEVYNDIKNKYDKAVATREGRKEFISNLTPEELERIARARSRELYKNYYKVLKRHRIDFDAEGTSIRDKDGKLTGHRHFFDKELPEDYNTSEEWENFKKEIEPFLKLDEWKENPEYHVNTAETVSKSKANNYGKTKSDLSINLKNAKTELNDFRNKNGKDIFTTKKIIDKYFKDPETGEKLKTFEEKKAAYYKKEIKPIEDLIKKNNGKDLEIKTRKKYDRFKTFEKYQELQTNKDKAYNDLSVFNKNNSIVAKFKNKINAIKGTKADNPFERPNDYYFNSPTGSVNLTQIKQDLDKMQDDKYLNKMAKIAYNKQVRNDKYGIKPKSLKKIIEEYKDKRTSLELNFGETLKANNIKPYKVKRWFKFGEVDKLSSEEAGYFSQKTAEELKSSPELIEFMKNNPNVKVEIADRGLYGNPASTIFDHNKNYTIVIDVKEVDNGNLVKLLEDEAKHVKQYDSAIDGNNVMVKNLKTAFNKADEAHRQYNLHSNEYDAIHGVIDAIGEDATKYLSDDQVEKVKQLAKTIEAQNKTKLEQEAHNAKIKGQLNREGITGDAGNLNSSNNEKVRNGQGNGGELHVGDNRGRAEEEATSQAVKEAADLSGFDGKSLNKTKNVDTLTKAIENFENNKSEERIKNYAKVIIDDSNTLELLGEQFGLTPEQMLGRTNKTGSTLYFAPVRKNGGKLNWVDEKTEKEGLFGKKSKDYDKGTIRERIIANKLEKARRLNIIEATNYFKDTYGEPVDYDLVFNPSKDIKKGYIGVNQKVLNAALYGRYGHNWYKTIMAGKDEIQKVFKNEAEAKAWIKFHNQNSEIEYQVPKSVFKSMMIDSGEDIATTFKRYGIVEGLNKAKNLPYDLLTEAFKRAVLGLNPGFIVGNAISDTAMTISKHDSLHETIKHFVQAATLKNEGLPPELFENNMFEATKRSILNKSYTGNKKVDCVLNLLGGRTVGTKDLKGIQKTLATAGNVMAFPRRAVHEIVNVMGKINDKVMAFPRKVLYVKALDDNQKAIIWNIGQRMGKQKVSIKYLNEIVSKDPKLADFMIKEVQRTLGDYNSLTPFERKALGRVVTFHSWFRTISRNLTGMMKENPTKFAMLALEKQKLDDENYTRKDYQSLFIPLRKANGDFVYDKNTGERIGINPTRYVNPFDTWSDAAVKPASFLHPAIQHGIEAYKGKSILNDKPLKDRRYGERSEFNKNTGHWEKYMWDNKENKPVLDKNGKRMDRLPKRAAVKSIPVKLTRDLFPEINSKTVDLENVYGALSNWTNDGLTGRAKHGVLAPYDTKYDTSFLGYNAGDYEGVKEIKRDDKPSKYISSYRYAKEKHFGTKIGQALLGGSLQQEALQTGKNLEAIQKRKELNKAKLFGYIPTSKSQKIKKEILRQIK